MNWSVRLLVQLKQKARDCVIRELQFQSGVIDNPEELPMVSSLLFTTGSSPQAKRWHRRFKNSKVGQRSPAPHDLLLFVVLYSSF